MLLFCVIMFTTSMAAYEAYLYVSVALTDFLGTFKNRTPGEVEVPKHILTQCHSFPSS